MFVTYKQQRYQVHTGKNGGRFIRRGNKNLYLSSLKLESVQAAGVAAAVKTTQKTQPRHGRVAKLTPLQQLREEAAQCLRDYKTSTDTLADCKKQLSKATNNSEWELLVQTERQEKKDIEKRLATVIEELETLKQTQIIGQGVELKEAQERVRQAEEKLLRAESALLEFKTLQSGQSDCLALQNELRDRQAELAMVVGQLDTMRKEGTAQRSALKEAQQRVRQAEEKLQSAESALRKSQADALLEFKTLQSGQSNCLALQQELRDRQAELTGVVAQLDTLRKESTAQRSALKEAQERFRQAEEKVLAERKAFQAERAEGETKRTDISIMEKELRDRKTELALILSERDTLRQESTAQRSALKEAKELVRLTEEKLHRAESEVTHSQEDVRQNRQALVDERKDRELEGSEFIGLQKELRARTVQLQTELEAAQKGLVDARATVLELQKRNEAEQAELERCRATVLKASAPALSTRTAEELLAELVRVAPDTIPRICRQEVISLEEQIGNLQNELKQAWPAHGDVLNLLSYNVKGYEGSGQFPDPDVQQQILTWLGRQSEVDIICLQEDVAPPAPTIGSFELVSSCLAEPLYGSNLVNSIYRNTESKIFSRVDAVSNLQFPEKKVGAANTGPLTGGHVDRCAALATFHFAKARNPAQTGLTVASVHLPGGRFDDAKWPDFVQAKEAQINQLARRKVGLIVGDWNNTWGADAVKAINEKILRDIGKAARKNPVTEENRDAWREYYEEGVARALRDNDYRLSYTTADVDGKTHVLYPIAVDWVAYRYQSKAEAKLLPVGVFKDLSAIATPPVVGIVDPSTPKAPAQLSDHYPILSTFEILY